MDKHYDFEDFEVKEETEEEINRKKKIRTFGGIFLAFLMLSFVIPQDVLHSFAASKTVFDNTIKLNNITIVFKDNNYETLRNYYFAHQLTEFKLCLTGTIANNTYEVTNMYAPRIIFASPTSVHSTICNQETIIDLHSHPFKECRASEQDSISYRYYKRNNPNVLAAVMCDSDRFGFYS